MARGNDIDTRGASLSLLGGINTGLEWARTREGIQRGRDAQAMEQLRYKEGQDRDKNQRDAMSALLMQLMPEQGAGAPAAAPGGAAPGPDIAGAMLTRMSPQQLNDPRRRMEAFMRMAKGAVPGGQPQGSLSMLAGSPNPLASANGAYGAPVQQPPTMLGNFAGGQMPGPTGLNTLMPPRMMGGR